MNEKKPLTVDDLAPFDDEDESTLAGGWWQPPDMSAADRQQAPAVPIARVSLVPATGAEMVCTAHDVTMTGILLRKEDAVPLSVGQFIEMTLSAAGLRLDTSAIVVRHADDGGFHARFIDVEPAQREQLARIVADAKP